MQIRLNSLELKNFKGMKDLVVNFGDITEIRGDNATGKTTLVDAFMWLLFGKDSADRKDFKIKTLDSNGEELHGLDHSVTGVLNIDGQPVTLQRLYKEKWTKTRGEANAELKSHTTEYCINEVPTSMKDYQAKVSSIFEERKFKLITSPLYFPSLKWQEQRAMLLEIIGDIEEETVINYNPKLHQLRDLAKDGIENLSKVVKAKISKAKEKISSIPYRIDEANNSILNTDFDILEFKKRNIQGGINSLDEQIVDKNKANELIYTKKSQLFKLKDEFQFKEHEAKQDVYKIESELRVLKLELLGKEDVLKRNKAQLAHLDETMLRHYDLSEQLRNKFKHKQSEVFILDENKCICPTCKRALDNIDKVKNELEINFKNDKNECLKEIRNKGLNIKADTERLKDNIEKLEQEQEEVNIRILDIQNNVKELENKLNRLKECKYTFDGEIGLKQQIEALESEIKEFKMVDNIDIKNKKRELQLELEEITKKLAFKDINENLRARIAELEEEERELSCIVAELEGQQFLVEEFIKTKVELLEDSINKKFNGSIRFKLFNKQINGGLNETCEALIDGVPFWSANSAAQINTGLSIINELSNHFNVHAPIFIDNAESINKIGDTDNQLINLKVSLDKKLRVEEI